MNIKILAFKIIVLLLMSLNLNAQTKHTISGYVKDNSSGELLIGVNIYVPGTQIGTVSNSFGFYSITLEENKEQKLKFSFIGYKYKVKTIDLSEDIELNINMELASKSLSEVEVIAEKSDKISRDVEMSVVTVPIKQIQEIPALLGEKDVFRVLQYMPGVKSGSEASSGLYVRGGGLDQNLIILDDATVYNAYHLFGFFSVFNGDALKSVQLWKGGFPARYGGRLSSVIDMRMKDGNKNDFKYNFDIGIISSKATIEGPIVEDKASFIISGRRTYIDILSRPFIKAQSDGGIAGYFFHDLNTKFNYEISDKDKLYLSFYYGKDKFYQTFATQNSTEDYELFWTNQTATLRWNHQFSNKLFSNLSAIFSNYKFQLGREDVFEDEEFLFKFYSGVRDYSLKYDFSYVPNPKHYIRFGLQSTLHTFKPSALAVKLNSENSTESRANEINTIENALYIEDEFKPVDKMKLNVGARFVNYSHKEKSYFSLEPRVLGSYMLGKNLSVKAAYAKMNQYIHLLSSTGLGLPTDLWVPATTNVGPQNSHQISLGLAKDIEKPALSISLEAYYKNMNNVISYSEGASFIQIGETNDVYEFDYEDQVTSGLSYSYGAELLFQKKYGDFSGWIGYTLSWTKMQFDELNFGKEFYAHHDRRHDISLVGIYKPDKNISLSLTWVYGTGDAINLSTGQYRAFVNDNSNIEYPIIVSDYGDRNSFRMAPYHRLDIGVNLKKVFDTGRVRTWRFSIYNVYNRKNPFFYFTDYSDDPNSNSLVIKQTTLFPFIPSISHSQSF